MQVGTTCTYTPTLVEQPMAQEKPQAAVVTAWDADNSKADLLVFPRNANYGYFKDGAVEGTDPGSFQQLGSSTSGASAQSASAKPEHEATAKQHEATHRGK